MNQYDLTGRNAGVTSGAQGIDRACVERFLSAGANLAIWDIDIELARKTANALSGKGSVVTIEIDASNWQPVQAATKETSAHFSSIDILINNVGISGHNAPLADYPVEEWHRIINLNLYGTFYCCKAITPIMQSNKYGRIVSLASRENSFATGAVFDISSGRATY